MRFTIEAPERRLSEDYQLAVENATGRPIGFLRTVTRWSAGVPRNMIRALPAAGDNRLSRDFVCIGLALEWLGEGA